MTIKLDDKINTLASIEIPNSLRQRIADSLSSGQKLKSVTVRMEATHSGKPNGNNWIYTPNAMMAGHKTFVSPVFRPVVLEHKEDSKTLGRVVDAKYVSYDNAPKHLERSVDRSYLRDYKKFMLSPLYKNKDFKGLGHIELTAKITDEESIKRILDNQYGFVSVGGSAHQAYCSICGSKKGLKSSCDHVRGAKYNGETCYYIGDSISFDHISYVATPADKNATSILIRDSKANESHFQILDFETTEGTTMTIKIEDFDKSNDSLVQHAEELGFKNFQLPNEESLTILDYVFGEEKTFPIADKVSALVAQDFFKVKFEDSEDKDAILRLIQDRLDELGVEDAQAELEALLKEQEPQEEEPQTVKDSINLEELAELVAIKVRDSISGTNYQNSQNKVLRAQLKDSLTKVSELESKLKASLVSQISELEKIEDSEKIEALGKRSLDSLFDKLQDLKSSKTTEEKISDSENKKTLEENGVKIEDHIDGKGSDEKEKIEDSKEETLVFKDSKEFDAAYKEILLNKGLTAAKEFRQKAKIES